MAMILEQFESRRSEAVRARVRIDDRPLRIGRGLDNDVIVDDPFVDVHHARIDIAADGTATLHDLGSINGIEHVGHGDADAIPLLPGTVVRLGRTVFRVRSTEEALPAAVPLPAAIGAPGLWVENRRWGLGLLGATFALTVWNAWGDTFTRDGAVEVLLVTAGALVFLALWAGAWALLGRLLARRPTFAVHVTIACASAVALHVAGLVGGWGEFLWPSVWPLFSGLEIALSVAVLALAVVGHLAYATLLSPRLRWMGVVGVVGLAGLLIGTVELLQRDRFSDVPNFSSQIRLLPGAMIPAGTIAEYNRSTMEAQQRADALADRAAARRRD